MAEAERRAWQTTSADVGAYLLGLWGLPVPLVDAAAQHRTPARSADQAFTPLTAVHVASVLAREVGPPSLERILPLLDVGYLQRLKLADRLPDWVSAASA
jgi:HD-like signal output (HDOD) protein